jgi:hypothetical protein
VRRFSLTAAKAKVLKSLEESVPPAFVRFFGSALFDRLLAALVLYFCCLFQQEQLRQWSERSRTAAHAGAAQYQQQQRLPLVC